MVIKDSELDFSNQEMFTNSNFADLPTNSMDSFFDDLLNDAHACTHTHTCNPPGPDYSHTHTCFHVHTKILPSTSEDKAPTDDNAESVEKKAKKRPVGNREAVRKYREKKKARTASLEDEVVRLRAVNQQLLKRLQGQAVLEAEIARLKCLLVDVRGRIDGELGSFPYQKSDKNPSPYLPASYVMNPCNLQCNDQVYCLHPGVDGRSGEGEKTLHEQGLGGCEFENVQCLGNQNLRLNELNSCGGLENGVPAVNTSNGSKRKATTLDCGVIHYTEVRASLSIGLRFSPSIFRVIPRF
ncbi:hypothetical protein LguiB_022401 [Lonicera macranthoides]